MVVFVTVNSTFVVCDLCIPQDMWNLTFSVKSTHIFDRRRKNFEDGTFKSWDNRRRMYITFEMRITSFSFLGWASEITWPIQYQQQVIDRDTVPYGHTPVIYRLSPEGNLGKEELCRSIYCTYNNGLGLLRCFILNTYKKFQSVACLNQKVFTHLITSSFPPNKTIIPCGILL